MFWSCARNGSSATQMGLPKLTLSLLIQKKKRLRFIASSVVICRCLLVPPQHYDLCGSPCLGACPRSDGRESILVTSSCHSSHLSVCTCVPHRPGFRRVSLFVGSLSCLSTRLSGWTLLSAFRVRACGFVLFGASSVDESSASAPSASHRTTNLVLRCLFWVKCFRLLNLPSFPHQPAVVHHRSTTYRGKCPLIFLSWRGWPRSQFHGYRDGAGCWFLLFHRPTLCVVLAVFLSMFLRGLFRSLPCSPSHVLRGHCGVWERVLVIAESLS